MAELDTEKNVMETEEKVGGQWRQGMYRRFGLVKDKSEGDVEEEERPNRVIDFFNKNVSKDSNFSWGLVLLLVVAAYAVFEIFRVILYFAR